VPYFVGFIGIIYNTKYVDEADIGGWDLLWNEKYNGKILQFNNARDAFGTALMKNGSSLNTLNMEEWEKALVELKAQKPQLQAYVMDEIYNKMESESAWIAPYYVGDFLTMYEENEDLAFFYPEGGTNIFADAMCIPKGSENKEIAEMYINFMLEKEIGIANSEFTYYASPNTLVNNDEEYIVYMNDIYDGASEILAPDFPEDYKLEYYHNFDDEMLVNINSLWEQLKIDSGSDEGGVADLGIYITCGVIVLGIATFFTARYIRNSKRRKYY
jgi:spermidine/putrescine transport system substrate-binding protein